MGDERRNGRMRKTVKQLFVEFITKSELLKLKRSLMCIYYSFGFVSCNVTEKVGKSWKSLQFLTFLCTKKANKI